MFILQSSLGGRVYLPAMSPLIHSLSHLFNMPAWLSWGSKHPRVSCDLRVGAHIPQAAIVYTAWRSYSLPA